MRRAVCSQASVLRRGALAILLFPVLTAASPAAELPGRYFRLLEAELPPLEKRLEAEPKVDLKSLEAQPGARHFPGAILASAVLYAKQHPANPSYRDKNRLALALKIGDLLADENEKGNFQTRLDNDWDLYMWLEAYRLLERELGDERRARWRKEIEENVRAIAADAVPRLDFPRYQGPFIRTSTNHYSLWASTVYLAGRVFQNKDWEDFGARALHRLAAEEQTADGYWGEHTDNGPTTGYNYLTMTGVALYAEYSKDPAALAALRRATDFHKSFTYPDGTPVETINGRNRHWGVSAWGHFGFSHFPDGRRYAEFLTGFLPEGKVGYHALGRLAQDALYYHEGPTAPIPQDLPRSVHQMKAPAGIRKTGPWVVCLSGLIDPPVESQFTLDRQGHLSIFHEKLGLIVTGANSKRQPELATFRDKLRGQAAHLPLSSRLRMSDARDRLGLAYQTCFAEIEVPTPTEDRLAFRCVVTEVGKGRLEEAHLTFQLCLKAGELLETGTGKWTLGETRLALGPKELGGRIRHRGWTLHLDPGARLTWPVRPFDPYRNAPEKDLRHAVGALTVPVSVKAPAASTLPWRRQEIAFALEAGNSR
jgi:hypothetical protein